ncbi:hypothetical protein [Amycolatopsis sp. NPDC051102]|uniref:hypothetical protein n=1 Tax=Amycolatopsis sp. NPDC051102 TaxID=3155163 RepID=UPI003429A9F1
MAGRTGLAADLIEGWGYWPSATWRVHDGVRYANGPASTRGVGRSRAELALLTEAFRAG